MDLQQAKAALIKPQVARLKDLGAGMRVGRVWGNRLLVKPVEPHTEMDEVEKKGLLYVPEKVKEQNTPLPSTGIVIAVGEGVSANDRWIFTPGTAVAFSKFSGHEYFIEKVKYRVIHLDEVLMTIDFDETAIAEVAE